MTIKKFTIFVIDDDKIFCSMLKCLADRDNFVYSIEGYKLSLAVFDDMAALDIAVSIIERDKPNLLLLDYYLGSGGCINSLDVLEKIICCCVGQTDISMITGMHPEDVRFKLVDAALTKMEIDIVQKPFGVGDLIELIGRSIRKRGK